LEGQLQSKVDVYEKTIFEGDFEPKVDVVEKPTVNGFIESKILDSVQTVC
jgi:hypothetical protein